MNPQEEYRLIQRFHALVDDSIEAQCAVRLAESVRHFPRELFDAGHVRWLQYRFLMAERLGNTPNTWTCARLLYGVCCADQGQRLPRHPSLP